MTTKKAEPTLVPLDEFYEHPTVMSQFPIVFGRGGKWDDFRGTCNKCGCAIPDDNLRGEVLEVMVEETFRSRVVTMYFIEARSYCEPCNLIRPCRYFLHESMHMGAINGKFIEIYGTGTRWSRFKKWFRELFRSSSPRRLTAKT